MSKCKTETKKTVSFILSSIRRQLNKKKIEVEKIFP